MSTKIKENSLWFGNPLKGTLIGVMSINQSNVKSNTCSKKSTMKVWYMCRFRHSVKEISRW